MRKFLIMALMAPFAAHGGEIWVSNEKDDTFLASPQNRSTRGALVPVYGAA